MDQIEVTKIAAAVLSALLLIVGAKTLIESKSAGHAQKVGYTLPGGTAPAAPAAADAGKTAAEAPKAAAAEPPAASPAAAPAGGGDALALLAKASADNGKAVFAKCKACHAVEKGKNGVGPSLWGVVDRPKGSLEGFAFSDAMKGKRGNWTFADLATFLTNPKGFVAGTKMVFNGLPAAADQADLIAFLASQADTPVALPK